MNISNSSNSNPLSIGSHLLRSKTVLNSKNPVLKSRSMHIFFITACNEVGQGYVFTRVCDSVHGGGVLSQHALQVISQHALQQVLGGVLSQHALQVVSQHALQQVSGGVCSGGGVPGPGGAWWRPPRMATAAGGTHPTGMHSCFHISFQSHFNDIFSLLFKYSYLLLVLKFLSLLFFFVLSQKIFYNWEPCSGEHFVLVRIKVLMFYISKNRYGSEDPVKFYDISNKLTLVRISPELADFRSRY